MARIRTVKPEFFRHEGLQDLEISNPGKYPMLVFEGLWTVSDKAGRFEWRPRQLKLDILPFLPFEMAETLSILEIAGFVECYEIDGKTYGCIPTFRDHQRITGTEAMGPERFPEPTQESLRKHQGNTKETPRKDGTGNTEGKGKGKGREKEREKEREQERGVGETEPENHLSVDNSKKEDEKPPTESSAPDQKRASLEKPEQRKHQNVHGERWSEEQGAELEELMSDIGNRYGKRYHQRIYVWVQSNFNRKNPDAVLHCLRRLITERLAGKPVPIPERWLDAVLNGNEKQPGENGKFEAAETDKESEQYKTQPATVGKILQEVMRAP